MPRKPGRENRKKRTTQPINRPQKSNSSIANHIKEIRGGLKYILGVLGRGVDETLFEKIKTQFLLQLRPRKAGMNFRERLIDAFFQISKQKAEGRISEEEADIKVKFLAKLMHDPGYLTEILKKREIL